MAEDAKGHTARGRGALWALLYLVLVECIARLIPAAWVVGVPSAGWFAQIRDYPEVNNVITLLDPPDVVILGSSRAREGLATPLLAEMLSEASGQPVIVHNYGLSDGGPRIWLSLWDRLEQRGRPKLLLLGISARALRDDDEEETKTRLTTLSTLPAFVAREGWPDERGMFPILQNAVPSAALRLRSTVKHRLFTLDLGPPRRDSGPSGGWSTLQTQALAAPWSLATHPVPDARVAAYVAREWPEGASFDTTAASENLCALLQRATQGGVEVLVVRLPVSEILQRHWPEGVQARFDAQMPEIVARCGGSWIVPPISFDDTDFIEQSHLSASGAQRLTRAIAPTVASALARTGNR